MSEPKLFFERGFLAADRGTGSVGLSRFPKGRGNRGLFPKPACLARTVWVLKLAQFPSLSLWGRVADARSAFVTVRVCLRGENPSSGADFACRCKASASIKTAAEGAYGHLLPKGRGKSSIERDLGLMPHRGDRVCGSAIVRLPFRRAAVPPSGRRAGSRAEAFPGCSNAAITLRAYDFSPAA